METQAQPPVVQPPSSSVEPNGNSSMMDADDADQIQPNQTIYINNLNERIKKEELRKSLYAMFTQFGTVLDVVASKTLANRGQAFVVFKDVLSATNAMKSMKNFPFFDKPMKIRYAKKQSDIIAKLSGSFVPADPKVTAKRRLEQAEAAKKRQKTAETSQRKEKKVRDDNKDSTSALNPKQQPPNKILFVEHLPEGCSDTTIANLFQQYNGFKEVRMVQGKTGIAFVEFDTDVDAGVAMNALQHWKVTPNNLMVISYAKK